MARSTSLKITPAPFHSSNLAIPPSPFSPRLPITPSPAALRPTSSTAFRRPMYNLTTSPPPNPLQWLWTCHMCHLTYPIGATRRCLDDGHFFCSGTTTIKAWRKSVSPKRRVKKHRACASEFDYSGWKVWGEWRREEHAASEAFDSFTSGSTFSDDESDSGASSCCSDESAPPPSGSKDGGKKDCWNKCDYPSECRWGKQFGVQTPPKLQTPVITSPAALTQPEIPPAPAPQPPTGFESILAKKNITQTQSSPTTPKSAGSNKADFWGALLASANRRKSASTLAPSPLSLHPITEETASVIAPEPAFVSPSSPSAATTSPVAAADAPFEQPSYALLAPPSKSRSPALKLATLNFSVPRSSIRNGVAPVNSDLRSTSAVSSPGEPMEGVEMSYVGHLRKQDSGYFN
ncbi:hypothetical protein H2199_001030 [Coniosporium tulheliwenetii]|uniref:Uncharacterized protein n=1 Tax=Coniosporium tulheliwenetii TaxID=3383036 RepID=A0ACC2ZNL7_9PEZI|nr:hypothetical protein H2199_001030 [Cladosporium sp. JES 115]